MSGIFLDRRAISLLSILVHIKFESSVPVMQIGSQTCMVEKGTFLIQIAPKHLRFALFNPVKKSTLLGLFPLTTGVDNIWFWLCTFR